MFTILPDYLRYDMRSKSQKTGMYTAFPDSCDSSNAEAVGLGAWGGAYIPVQCMRPRHTALVIDCADAAPETLRESLPQEHLSPGADI